MRIIITATIAAAVLALALGACSGDGTPPPWAVEDSPGLDRCISRAEDEGNEEGVDLCLRSADCLADAQTSDDIDVCTGNQAVEEMPGAEEFLECSQFAADEAELDACADEFEEVLEDD